MLVDQLALLAPWSGLVFCTGRTAHISVKALLCITIETLFAADHVMPFNGLLIMVLMDELATRFHCIHVVQGKGLPCLAVPQPVNSASIVCMFCNTRVFVYCFVAFRLGDAVYV